MTHPDEETLAGLALGDAAGASDDLAHVATCPSCSATVADLRRVADAVSVSPRRLDLAAPPAGLFDRIEAQIDDEERDSEVLDQAHAVAPSPAIAQSPPTQPVAARARRRWGPVGRAAGAAAAGIAIGLLAGYAVWNEPAPPAPVEVASTRLDTLDTRQWQGMATLLREDDQELLSVRTERLDAGSGYLEVWLLNRDGKRMVSLGVLRSDGRSSFPVTQQLIDEGYVIVDISREGFDERPEHSGDSLVRGTLKS
ncbi:anti-sigma factor domain-containing protein [Phycicoccus sp. Root101]|uniref:anti-sigma factor domain-containing protein n=1 Tax=Phycicoccus sp. Root101 TaxID=1736421 RepID=UPI0007025C89|nr:anti-sigma factor [Phycicoccus sp. Root101]KQU70868.1 hypothetical protein ASC58_03635 [Phycicoccus sp. Root101]